MTETNYLPDRKRCTRCGVVKDNSEFYRYSRTLKSGEIHHYLRSYCKSCERSRTAAWKNRKKQRGEWTDYLRERKRKIMSDPRKAARLRRQQRESATVARRRKGMRAYAVQHRYQENGDGPRLPIEPFSAWLAGQCVNKSVADIAHRTGYDERYIRRLISKKSSRGKSVQKVSLDVVDRICVSLGHPDQMSVLYPE